MKRNVFVRNAVLLLFVIVTIAVRTSAQTPVPSGVVGWWAGDGDERDISGLGNNGTPVPNPFGYAIGKVGQAFNFTTEGQRISIPDGASLQPQSLTVEGWGNLTAVNSAAPTFFGKALGSGNSDSYIVWYQSGTLHGAICNNSGCAQLDAPSFSLNVWHHIAFTFDDPGGATTKTLVLYVDGVSVASGTTTGAVGYDTHPALIGADYDFGSIKFSWTGGLDEITLYNRALSAAEILAIKNAGINGKTKQAATNAGANLPTVVNDATITFANVSTPGTTTDYTIDPTTAGTLPAGYTQTGLAYDISTTAVYSGLITECFHIPSISDATVFSKLKVLHSEGGMLVDKTISTDFANRLVCGRTASLSPFVIANGLAPTAASISIGGQVTVGGRGLARARVTLTDSSGATSDAITDSFGYYRFEAVAAGDTFVLSVASKRYTFAPQVLTLAEGLEDLNFTAEGYSRRKF